MAEENNENVEEVEEPEAVEGAKEEEAREEEEAKPVFKAKKSEEFEPKIIGFLCNWCTASAADLAGTTRAQYPPNLHPIRVMCSGTVDPVYIIKALLSGADAVMVGGCHPGDCHYISGNYKARRRIAMLKAIFEALGLEDNRIWARWISASEGPEFAQTVRDITEETKKQGPSALAANWAL